MTTREQVVQAVFTRITTGAGYTMTSRRLSDPDAISPENTPILMLVEHSEIFERSSSSLPPTRRLNLRAIIYTDVGDDENAIPAATINALLDQMEVSLKPDDKSVDRCTLGGLVQSVQIDGEIEKAPGDITGKSLAIVPIVILLP